MTSDSMVGSSLSHYRIAARLGQEAFYYLDAPVKRMGAMDVPVPFSPALEDLTVPTEDSVAEMAKALCGRT